MTEEDWLKARKVFNQFDWTLTIKFLELLKPSSKIKNKKSLKSNESHKFVDKIFESSIKTYETFKENYTNSVLTTIKEFLIDEGMTLFEIWELREAQRVYEELYKLN